MRGLAAEETRCEFAGRDDARGTGLDALPAAAEEAIIAIVGGDVFVALDSEFHLQTGENGEHVVEEGGDVDHTCHGIRHRTVEAAHRAAAGHEDFAAVQVGQSTSEVEDDVGIGGEHEPNAGAGFAFGSFETGRVRLGHGKTETDDLAATASHEELRAIDKGGAYAHLQTVAVVAHLVGVATAEGVVETPKFVAEFMFFGDVRHAGAGRFTLFEQGDGETVGDRVVSAASRASVPIAQLVAAGNEQGEHLALGVHATMGFGHPPAAQAFAARFGGDS